MKLSELVEFNPQTPIVKGVPAPFIDMASLPVHMRDVSRVSQKLFKGSGSRFINGDTLLARITPCLENGKGALVNSLQDQEIGFGSTEFIVLRAKQRSDREFAYYVSRLPEFRKFAEKRMSGTSGRQRVDWRTLKSFELVPVSPRNRQAAGSILGTLDDKIELNQKMNETLEEIAKAIFKSWFVDFDPVRAKMDGRPTGLPDDISNLFPDELVDSEIGEIPKGWGTTTLVEQLKFVLGGDWGKAEASMSTPKGCYCIRGADIASLQKFRPSKMPQRFIKKNLISKTRIGVVGCCFRDFWWKSYTVNRSNSLSHEGND